MGDKRLSLLGRWPFCTAESIVQGARPAREPSGATKNKSLKAGQALTALPQPRSTQRRRRVPPGAAARTKQQARRPRVPRRAPARRLGRPGLCSGRVRRRRHPAVAAVALPFVSPASAAAAAALAAHPPAAHCCRTCAVTAAAIAAGRCVVAGRWPTGGRRQLPTALASAAAISTRRAPLALRLNNHRGGSWKGVPAAHGAPDCVRSSGLRVGKRLPCALLHACRACRLGFSDGRP